MTGDERPLAPDPDTIHIGDDSEIARLLDHVDAGPLRLERNGVVYRVMRDESGAGYDPGKVRAAVQVAAGMLTPEEGEALKAYLYRAREEGSRPATRP